jgi:hypothetical protein
LRAFLVWNAAGRDAQSGHRLPHGAVAPVICTMELIDGRVVVGVYKISAYPSENVRLRYVA